LRTGAPGPGGEARLDLPLMVVQILAEVKRCAQKDGGAKGGRGGGELVCVRSAWGAVGVSMAGS